jgi:hypothetical protein
VVGVLLALLWGLPLMLLWNWLMPTLFGLTTITFWQAVGLNILCVILFKGSNTSNSSKN